MNTRNRTTSQPTGGKGEIEQAAQTAAVAVQAPEQSLAQRAVARVEELTGRFGAVLPTGWNRDRFTNVVVTCIKRDPNLVKCFATPAGEVSLIVAIMQCAVVGLEPNTILREAVILPRRKGQGRDAIYEAQLIIEYRGLIKLARRSGEIATLRAVAVHERDEFTYTEGLDPTIEHVPYMGDDDPGELTHAYAVVKFKDGTDQFVVVPRRVVYNQHRARSDSWRNDKSRPYSPWTTDEEAMWRKTAIRVLEPYLPLTAEARNAFESDERVLAIDDGMIVPTNTGEIIDVDEGGKPALEAGGAVTNDASEPIDTSSLDEPEAPPHPAEQGELVPAGDSGAG